MNIYLWFDGSWCHEDELSQMTHKSDDYVTAVVSDERTDAEIDALVYDLANPEELA